MKRSNIAWLVLLAAIWGGSYPLMRVIAPVFGGIGTMWLRIGIAGLALLIYAVATRSDLQWRQYGKQYLVAGLVNAALPFSLIAYGMKTLPAGYGAILNAASPFFAALFAMAMLGEKLTQWRVLGLATGFAGVALTVNLGPIALAPAVLMAAAACVAATCSYGFASVYLKKNARNAPQLGLTAGSMLLAWIVTAPVALPMTSWQMPGTGVFLALLALGLLCSALATLIYFRLIMEAGPTQAVSVTFLIPFFGILWGALFLGERMTAGSLLGGAIVLVGVALTLGLWPRRPAPQAATS